MNNHATILIVLFSISTWVSAERTLPVVSTNTTGKKTAITQESDKGEVRLYAYQVKRDNLFYKRFVPKNKKKGRILIENTNDNTDDLKVDPINVDEKLANLNQKIEIVEASIAKLNRDLNSEMQKSYEETTTLVKKVAEETTSKLEIVIAGFSVILIFIAALLFFLRRCIYAFAEDTEKKIHIAKSSLEKEALGLDIKLIEILENQIFLPQEKKSYLISDQEVDIDHSLVLKVADEITRMQKNIYQMGPSVKGIKPLTKGLDRIRKNFMANGYEILDLLNKPYNSRMNIDVINYVDNPALGEEDKVIVKVIRPQVNFNGVLIQRAQVDVAAN